MLVKTPPKITKKYWDCFSRIRSSRKTESFFPSEVKIKTVNTAFGPPNRLLEICLIAKKALEFFLNPMFFVFLEP